MSETLPYAVRSFLREYIESYEQLEMLLLLLRQPGETWTALRLGQRMQLPRETIDEALDGLARARCVNERMHPGDAVRYAPCDAGQAAAIGTLATAYEENSLAIIKLMSANAIERVRWAAIHTFADAFVIGRKKDG